MDEDLYQYFTSLLDATNAKKESGKDSVDEIDKEYSLLEQVPPSPGRPNFAHYFMVEKGLCEAAVKNEIKNRYCNLFPFDTNLVRLEKEEEYINASWIELPKDSGDNSSREYLSLPNDKEKNREYIVTMGPLHPSSYVRIMTAKEATKMDTCAEFWKLCWMSGSRIIVMLCGVSPGFQGCSQYFPISQGKTNFGTFESGMFHVTELETILSTDDYIEKEFLLEKISKEETPNNTDSGVSVESEGATSKIKTESRRVRHLQFKTWPNYGVPDAVKPIAEFISHVYNRKKDLEKEGQEQIPKLYLPNHGNPELLIHCSGGIGRSGTFLTAFHHYSQYMDILVKKEGVPSGHENDGVSLKETVHFMRLQRHPWMVEGEHQYTLAYQTVIYLLKNQILRNIQNV